MNKRCSWNDSRIIMIVYSPLAQLFPQLACENPTTPPRAIMRCWTFIVLITNRLKIKESGIKVFIVKRIAQRLGSKTSGQLNWYGIYIFISYAMANYP